MTLLCFLFGIEALECGLRLSVWCLRGSGVRNHGLEFRDQGLAIGEWGSGIGIGVWGEGVGFRNRNTTTPVCVPQRGVRG